MKRLLFAALLALTATAVLSAQDFKTGYFLDGYTYGYRINPGAPVGNETYTFLSIGLGNISAEARSDLSMASFLSPSRDAWIIDSSVSLNEALSGFSENNGIGLNANVNLLTFGRETDHNRFSIELNARSDSFFNLPLSFVSSAKKALIGLSTDDWPSSYSFSDMSLNSNAFTEIAFGYTEKINDALTVGGRLKGIVGLASVNANVAADVNIINQGTSTEAVAGKLMGGIDLASPMSLDFATFTKGSDNYLDLYRTNYGTLLSNAMANKHRHITGWGAGVDLGLTYEPIDGLDITLSALDLGFITWDRSYSGTFTFDDTVPTKEDLEGDLGSQILALKVAEEGKNTLFLNYTLHAGVTYRMPFYEQWNVGVIGTVQQHYKELRLGTGVTPLDFLSIAASLGLGSYGTDFGLALNLDLPILNFFVGTDAIVLPSGSVKPVYGTKLNTMLTAGLVLTFPQ